MSHLEEGQHDQLCHWGAVRVLQDGIRGTLGLQAGEIERGPMRAGRDEVQSMP